MEGLLGELNGALVNPSGKVLHRDKLWESYFYIHSKETFINRWTVFLCSANSPVGSPVLYQHLTDLVFKEMLHSKYFIVANDTEKASTGPLTYNEVNALRYAAGYVSSRWEENRGIKSSTQRGNGVKSDDYGKGEIQHHKRAM